MARKKCYIYTRVSSAKQVEGYSLDAQHKRLEDYANFRNMEIAGVYSDEGFSGKSIEGRPAFSKMIQDIQSEKDGISFVLVFKLSRFGRNSADILKSMNILADYGIDLISVDDGIDSATSGGKFTMTILSAVAEIERENIRDQFLSGRLQSIKKGNWGGGPLPFGYRKSGNGVVLYEDEATIVNRIFHLYVDEDYTIGKIVSTLNADGFEKKTRNGIRPFMRGDIATILNQSFYCGRIVFGKNSPEFKKTKSKDLLIEVRGTHPSIVTEEIFDLAQKKRSNNRSLNGSSSNKDDGKMVGILSGILKCPICGRGLNGESKVRKNYYRGEGIYGRDYIYSCPGHNSNHAKVCSFGIYLKQEKVDAAVFEIIGKRGVNEDFADVLFGRLGRGDALTEMREEIRASEKKRDRMFSKIKKYGVALDTLDDLDEDFFEKYERLSEKRELYFELIDKEEENLAKLKANLAAMEMDVKDADNIMKILRNFDRLLAKMTASEKKEYCKKMIDRVDLYERKREDGRILRSITLKFPMSTAIDDNNSGKEGCEKTFVVDCEEIGLTAAEAKATYPMIKEYVLQRHGCKVSSLYIAQVKGKYGIETKECYRKARNPGAKQLICPKVKEGYIVEALRHYRMLGDCKEIGHNNFGEEGEGNGKEELHLS